MGGKAFDSHGLYTPRMPPAVYRHVLAEVQSKLRSVYAVAETPIEGPAKSDYGDVDVLVVAKEGEGKGPDTATLMTLLGAEKYIHTPNSATTHFALPWPIDHEQERTETTAMTDDDPRARFIQVDVNLCPTVAAQRQLLFLHAHGDVGTTLGAMLRRFGFLLSPSGLYLRIPELEKNWAKSASQVKLSDDPTQILVYLGLDPDRYFHPTGFGTWDAAFDYVSACRFHDPRHGSELDTDAGTPLKFDEVKHHDRSKAKQRPMFRYWFETYLPSHRTTPQGSASQMTRGDQVVADAVSFFGPDVRAEFEHKRSVGVREMGRSRFWTDVRRSLSVTGADLTFAMKGLKRDVAGEKVSGTAVEPDEEGERVDGLIEVRSAYERGDYDTARRWVDANWARVGERQRQRDRAQSTAKFLTHLENQKQKETASTDEEKN